MNSLKNGKGSKANRRSKRPRSNAYRNKPQSFFFKQGDQHVLQVTKNLLVTASIAPSATFVSGGFAFTLNDLPELSSFTNLYEFWRLDSISLEFIPITTMVTVAASAQQCQPLLVALDYEGVSAPPNVNSLLDYTNLTIIPVNKRKKISFRPRALIGATNGSTIQSGISEQSPWIGVGTTGIQHYGVRYGIAASTTQSNGYAWAVYAKYFVSFKGTF
jgi:hypothetical protein